MGDLLPLFARQPIFDQNLEVIAYELLFRGGLDNFASPIDGDQATSHVLLYAFGEHRIQDIIGDVPAYINFTRHLLVFPPPLPPEQLVIEILEDVTPDKHILQSLQELRSQGYKIALDDFFINRDTKVLISYADTIKIDVLALTEEQLEKYVKHLKPLNLKLLAEKIETYEMFEKCKALGFDFFQGYFLSKPHIVSGFKITESKESVLRLMATLTAADTDIKTVTDVIACDPRLTYKILKIVNSTACNVPNNIESLSQAVALLGINQIRNWAAFLVMANAEGKPPELCILGMTRAKLAERIGAKLGGKRLADTSFTTGLLSTFDAFMDMPIDRILESINLSDDVSDALTHRLGILGEILDAICLLERGEWQTLQTKPLISQGKISESEFNTYYADALTWAEHWVKSSY